MTDEGSYSPAQQLFHAVIPKVMGTRLEWITCGMKEKPARMLWERFSSWVSDASARLNRFDPSSEVSRLNSGECLEPSADVAALMDLGHRYKALTDGLFDVQSGGSLDFGGMAKGWALEKAKDLLERAGCSCAFLNFGGSSILALGTHPNGPAWQVALPDPFSGITLDLWNLKDAAMSVSGNVPGYTGHIENPLTGERITARRLTVAVDSSPLRAEVLSTALMISPERHWEQRFPSASMKCYNV
ncbi:MAG: FAD:protein FMN transferase [Bacteroidales bacterium]|nr:FAD:protein FMN transferase [Bacteroidales bacterium]